MKPFYFFVFSSLICLVLADVSEQCDSDSELDDLDRKVEDCCKDMVVKTSLWLPLASTNANEVLGKN